MASTINALTSGGGLAVSGDTSGSLQLQTNNGTTAMTIDTSQNVGIGTSSPQSKLGFSIGTNTVIGQFASSTHQAGNVGSIGIGIGDGSGSGVYSGVFVNNTFNGTYSSQDIRFLTAQGGISTSTERMRIDSSGNLCVGTTTNSGGTGQNARVESLASTSNQAFGASSPNSYSGVHYISSSLTTAGIGWLHFNGQSGNGSSVTTNNILIYGNGNVQNANNSYGAISDIKLKENIVDASPKLEKLMQVKVRNYNLKGNYEQHKQIGVVAQELEQIFPSMVEETPDKDIDGNDLGTTTKSVKYSVFVPMLIKAIQEQQAIITDLKARIETLEGAKA